MAGVQGYTPLPHRGFGGGLNLRDKPDVTDETQAIDALNVEFTERGAVAQRGGYAKFNGSELTNQPDSLAPFYKTDGTKRLIVGNGNRLDALDSTGASTHNVATTASPHFFTRFGGPTAERIYIANGTDNVRYYDGAGFTTPAYTGTAPDGKYLAVTPWDNRLLNANRVGTAGGDNPSSLRFAAVGDPHTWDADDWIDFGPGDGEQIMGLITWRDLVFVFKETKFWVIYQTGVAENGDDTLLYRPVDAGVGLAAPRALASHEEGVYFLSREGIYRTIGGPPQLASDPISPIFEGGAAIYFKGEPLNHTAISACAMTVWEDRVYTAYPVASSSTNTHIVVFDPRGWWSFYDIPAAALGSFRVGSDDDLVFAYPTGLNHIGRHRPRDSKYLADDCATDGSGGNAIVGRWRSGWADYGQTEEKVVRELKLWGTGECDVATYENFQDAADSDRVVFGGSSDLFEDGTNPSDLFEDGTNPLDLFAGSGVITSALVRRAHRGTTFSLEFKNSTLRKTFAIHRAAYHLREVRTPSVIG